MADRIVHVCLNVPDAADAVEWYTTNVEEGTCRSTDWLSRFVSLNGRSRNYFVGPSDAHSMALVNTTQGSDRWTVTRCVTAGTHFITVGEVA